MNLLQNLQVQAARSEWKSERLNQIQRKIEIERRMLQLLHQEMAQLRRLDGLDLAARLLCEKPEELEATMHGKRIWLERIKTSWITCKHPEPDSRKAA